MPRIIIFVFFSIFIAGSSVTNAADMYDCGGDENSTVGTLKDIQVSGCGEDDEKCTLTEGEKTTISLTFMTKAPISNIVADVKAGFGGLTIKIPIKGEQVCEDEASGVNCPLSNGMTYTYTKTVEIKNIQVFKAYNKRGLQLYWSLKTQVVDTDDDSEPDPKNPKKPKAFPIVCAQIPILIGDPPAPAAPSIEEEPTDDADSKSE